MSDATTDTNPTDHPSNELDGDLAHDVRAFLLLRSVPSDHLKGSTAVAAAQAHAMIYIGDAITDATASLCEALNTAFAPRTIDEDEGTVAVEGGSVVERLHELVDALGRAQAYRVRRDRFLDQQAEAAAEASAARAAEADARLRERIAASESRNAEWRAERDARAAERERRQAECVQAEGVQPQN